MKNSVLEIDTENWISYRLLLIMIGVMAVIIVCLTMVNAGANEFGRKYGHYPVVAGSCNDCHGAHQALGERLTREGGGNNLCYMCHQDKKFVYPDTVHAQAEGEEGKGLCINCHEPHSAERPILLRDEMDELCVDCHTQTQAHHFLSEDETDGGHEELADKHIDCAECHNPHGSVNEAFLKTAPDNTCVNCHADN